jgi:hypothetical protein
VELAEAALAKHLKIKTRRGYHRMPAKADFSLAWLHLGVIAGAQQGARFLQVVPESALGRARPGPWPRARTTKLYGPP